MFKPDVICLGSATLDHFLTIDQPFNQIKFGDKIMVNFLERHSGGGATNSAAALKKLGLKVKLLTKLGHDYDAQFILKELQQYKIRNICLHHSHKNTDTSTVISSTKEKDRLIYVHKGASQDLNQNDFKKSQLKANWLYLATLMGNSFQTAKEIVKQVKKKKTKVLFNPSLYLAKKGKRYLKEILEATEVLVLNKKEAQTLLKTQNPKPETLLLALKKLGPETIVITQGPKTIWALHQDTFYSLTPPKVKVVHTAGAGDAFTSGLLAGLIKKYTFEDALRLGLINSLSVIRHLSTKNKLLSEKEAWNRLRKYQLKVKLTKTPFSERRFYLLPFDHRRSFFKMLNSQAPPTKKDIQRAKAYKKIIYQAFLYSLKKLKNKKQHTSLLIDPWLGKELLFQAKKRKITTCLTLEKSGQAEFQFESRNYKKQLKQFAPDYAKVLLRYAPKDKKLNLRQAKKLAVLSDYLQKKSIKFLLEIITPDQKPKTILKALKQFQEQKVFPDVWKIEGLAQPKDMKKISEQINSKIIILGKGESRKKVEQWLKTAAPFDKVIGFAIGRTVFQKPLEQYQKNQLTKKQAIHRISDNYLHFIRVFETFKKDN